jgi:dephospho-CoA kinase
MASLLGITGYSGAGKTTAIEHLVSTCGADRIYVGQLVADEVAARGMAPGPESEKAVRKDLRKRVGMEGLAVLVAPAVSRSLTRGKPVIIDAICCLQEMDYYRRTFDQSASLVSIIASFDVRAIRVHSREEKRMTVEQLRERDDLENTFLRTDLAIRAATIAICNNGDLIQLHQLLDDQVRHLVA